MKNLLVLLSKCIIGSAFIGGMIGTPVYSQSIFPLDEKGEIVYSEVVKVDSAKSSELFVRAHEWFANTFKSAKAVIQLDDKEAGKIVGKGVFDVSDNNNHNSLIYVPWIGTVDFTVEIQTKDGRYKYVLSNIVYTNTGTGYQEDLRLIAPFTKGMYHERLNKQWSDIRQNTNTTILNMIDGLKKSMNTNTNNW